MVRNETDFKLLASQASCCQLSCSSPSARVIARHAKDTNNAKASTGMRKLVSNCSKRTGKSHRRKMIMSLYLSIPQIMLQSTLPS